MSFTKLLVIVAVAALLLTQFPVHAVSSSNAVSAAESGVFSPEADETE